MNRGDTAILMLDYTFNGDPLQEGAYQEIELQLNPQGAGVKKLLSLGQIVWGSVTYEDNHGDEQTFTGYYAFLTQEETFNLRNGKNTVQLRVMINDEVGSSAISEMSLGEVLSNKVLTDGTD